jgi:hypothetical protein
LPSDIKAKHVKVVQTVQPSIAPESAITPQFLYSYPRLERCYPKH